MTLGRSRRMVSAAVLFAFLVSIGAGTACGHAELATVEPADKSTVQGSPTQIVMTFVQNLDPTKSSIVVVDAGGKVVVQGGTVPAGKPREMDLVLTTPLAPGAYAIRWTTSSTEDGETARSTTTFTVAAAPSAAPSATPSASSAPPSSTPSVAPSLPPSPTPSTPPTAPVASTGDAVIPIVVALIVVAGLGLWLFRGRSPARG